MRRPDFAPLGGLVLLVLLASAASLASGVLVAHWGAVAAVSWLLLAGLLLADAGCAYAAYRLWRRAERGKDGPGTPPQALLELYDLAPCGHFALDEADRIAHVNDTALHWLGYGRAEVVGRPIGDLVASGSEALVAGPVRDLEVQLVRRDGGQLSGLISSREVASAGGRKFTSFVFVDITERKRAEERLEELSAHLRAAHDAAMAANQAKSNFLASMSHEIRTPLSSIVGMIELLQQTPVNRQQRGYLETLGRSAETLLALINDVLDISKIEAGRLELEEAPFELRELIAQVVSVLSGQAERKGLALRQEVAAGVPEMIVGDVGRLRQVLLNLLANAVKFTEHGSVTLRVQPEVQSAECRVQSAECRAQKERQKTERSASSTLHSALCTLHFAVTDTGIGIPQDKLAVIFEPFAQADASTSRTHGGTGLGLTISARLVERMGGRLTVSSTPGQGSTFAFTLTCRLHDAPAPPPEASTLQPPPPVAPTAGARLLLVEDNAINQEVMTLLLEKAGYTVHLASNGEEALAAFEKERFDLILMDLQMPGMDGLRATRLIRAREKAVGGHVPIVAVTANALSGERQRCLQAGMDDYLSKPIRGAELFPTLQRLLGGRDQPAAAPPEPATPADWLAGLAGMGFEAEAIARLARTFLDTVPPRLLLLRQALAEGNAAQVQATAHSLKGSLSVFAAREALETAQKLEAMGQSKQLADGEEVLVELEARVGTLVGSMRQYLQTAP